MKLCYQVRLTRLDNGYNEVAHQVKCLQIGFLASSTKQIRALKMNAFLYQNIVWYSGRYQSDQIFAERPVPYSGI